MELPEDLRSALETVLDSSEVRVTHRDAGELSRRYRAGHVRARSTFVRSQGDILAYLTARLPATFAAITSACAATARLMHAHPRAMLDVGAGPGTAAWAATAIWPEIDRVRLQERDDRMIELGRRLAERADHEALRTAEWLGADIVTAKQFPMSDLVTACYVLGEVPGEEIDGVVRRLWAATNGVLVVVEPGTPRGFEVIRRVRALLIEAGGTVAAPCPHNLACPMRGGDWCHFAQRISRSRRHRLAKGAQLGYEDEKYSYVAVCREEATAISARVLRHPRIAPGRIQIDVCATDGLRSRTITRAEREEWRSTRKLTWGDALD